MAAEIKNALLAAATLVFIVGMVSSRLAAQTDDSTPKVALTVDYGDGVEKHFTRIRHRGGMTVLSATEQAGKHPRGIKYKTRGRGATAFLYRIDDLENEAGGRGWLFRVNGKLADRSIGIFLLKPGDNVLWKFGNYQ